MPMLFYGDPRAGTVRENPGRHLYNEHLRQLDDCSVWSSFRIDGLAAYPPLNAIANIWHMPKKRHTAISWNEDFLKHEQTVFLPGLLDQREALELARLTFERVIPSPIIFRFRQNYHEVLLYD